MLFSGAIIAQQGLSPLGMRQALPLASWSPAQAIDTGFVISLPSIFLSGFHTGPNIWQGLEKDANGDPFIDLNKWVDQLDATNTLRSEIEVQTLALHWRSGRHQWGVHHGVRGNIGITYPKELALVLSRGNAAYIGETLSIGPDIQWNFFHEIGLSYAYQADNWSLGARIKRLQGLEHIRTSRNELSLYTDPEYYQLRFDVDYQVRQAGILDISDDFRSVTLSPGGLWNGFSFQYNGGWAMDLGMSWRPAPHWQIEAAALDLGSIRWDRNGVEYRSEGSYTYEGIDIREIIDLDTLNFDAQLDTLKEKLNFTDEPVNFTTRLPLRLVASVRHELSPEHWLTLSGIFRQGEGTDPQMGLALQWNAQWLSWLSTGLQYSVQNEQYDHLGINVMFDFRWLRLYGWTDNLMHLPKERNVHINGGVGMILCFQ